MPAILRYFLTALQFLTRFPVPGNLATTGDDLGKAAAFFPLIGTIVGGAAAGVFISTAQFMPVSAAVLLAIAFATFITNGFHEDGLADTFDALGGAWTKERALEIMRDSRLGTYGTLALIFLLLGKYTFLSSLEPREIWRWLIVAHTASRWTILPLCMWLPYARAEGQGKLVAKQIGSLSLVLGSITLALVLLLLPFKVRLIVLAITLLVTFASGLYFKRRLEGITGDTLGAANQINEVLLYLAALVLMKVKL
jgi:adenosylcobinamide-GDP ribazoletransferase